MAPRRKCPVCGSKQWHKEPSSGLVTCSEGHVLQNYRSETREVNELGPHAVRKRHLKSGKKKQEERSRADPKLYHGKQARYHYMECLQLMLRMQVVSLMRIWQLPPDFERVCRELWAMHLSLLPEPPTAEPLLHLGDGLEADATTQQRDVSVEREDEDERKERSSASSSSSSSDSDQSDHDSELDELMRENSPSSSSEDEDEDPRKDRSSMPAKRRRRAFGVVDAERPASTISVLVLACWTLRVPVMYMDFVRLIDSYDLPYLDALRLLPENMVRPLRKQTARALSPHFAPHPLHLHSLSSRLARLLYKHYDIYTPEMNAAPILWKAVRSLEGSPTLYVMAKKLARLMSVPLTLHRSLVPAMQRKKKKDPHYHKHDHAVPEVALVAAVIVVMKMVYGLDGKQRQPVSKEDPACALPTLPELIRVMKEEEQMHSERTPVFSLESNRSVLDMDDEMLDEYMTFCEKALLPREDRLPPRNATTDQFPLTMPSDAARTEGAPREQNGGLRRRLIANAVHDDSSLKPGENYTIYHAQDILGSLPDEMDFVVSRAAKWAGVDEDYVVGVVERFERRVVRWWDLKRPRTRQQSGKSSGQE